MYVNLNINRHGSSKHKRTVSKGSHTAPMDLQPWAGTLNQQVPEQSATSIKSEQDFTSQTYQQNVMNYAQALLNKAKKPGELIKTQITTKKTAKSDKLGTSDCKKKSQEESFLVCCSHCFMVNLLQNLQVLLPVIASFSLPHQRSR